MKRLFATIVISSMTLGIPAASADEPSATAKIRDYGNFFASFPMGQGSIDLWMNYERVTTPAPSVDPGSVFPITIDPNDPPTAPAGAVQEALSFSGYLFACDYSIGGCWDLPITNDTVPAGFLTFEDSPLAGNAITLSGTLALENGPFPLGLEIDLRAARPQVTRLWTDDAIVHPNVWVDGADAHAGTDTYIPLLTRHTYTVSGSATTSYGTEEPWYGAVGFNREVDAFTSADVPA